MATETITLQFIEENITLEISGTATWDSLAGKPVPVAENTFMVANASLAWVVKTQPEVKAILTDAVQPIAFADPLDIDATTYKDWLCDSVTDDTTVNLTGIVDGDAGIIELIIDGTGGYTVVPGAMFTKNAGGGTIDTTAAVDNIIAWFVSGTDIIYSIIQIS